MAAGELPSFPTMYPCSQQRAAARTNWKLLSQIHGGWESTDGAKRHNWSGRTAQGHLRELICCQTQLLNKKKQPILSLFTVEIKLTFHFLQPWCFSFLPLCSFATAVSSFHMLLVQSESLRLIIKSFRELRNRSQGKFKFRPYNPSAIATVIFLHNNLTNPGCKEKIHQFCFNKKQKRWINQAASAPAWMCVWSIRAFWAVMITSGAARTDQPGRQMKRE